MPTVDKVNSRRLLRSSGFTLIEVLIALAITAFVAIIAYTSLSSVISGVESTRTAATRNYELNRALMILTRDLRQFTARPVVDEFGVREPALSGGELSRYLLSFTRSGWNNPNGHRRSNLQRVNYLLEDNALWRESYNVLDRVSNSQPQKVKLLEGVEEVSIIFLSSLDAIDLGDSGKGLDTRNWLDNWIVDTSTPGASLPPPAALELSLQIKGWGEIRRLYALPPL